MASKYAIVYSAMNGVKAANGAPVPYPVTVSYGLVRSFESQRAAYLHAKEIFGSSYEKMGAKIVSMPDALKYVAVHCEVRSGYYISNGRGGFSVDKTKKRYRELYQGFVDGYKREIRIGRGVIARERCRVKAAKLTNSTQPVNTVKSGSVPTASKGSVSKGTMTDKELRLAMYQETGKYHEKGVQVKSLGDIEL